jgi:GNAT superfamily N-acetyltransferase
MSENRVHIRRGRRTDFTAVMELLAASDTAVPPPERASLRRFRQLVNDLGGDFYLALVDGQLAGLVHVTYARQLAAAPAARLEWLVVATAHRRSGTGTALLCFAQRRARQRGCGTLSCTPPDGIPGSRAFLEKGGLTVVRTAYTQAFTDCDR